MTVLTVSSATCAAFTPATSRAPAPLQDKSRTLLLGQLSSVSERFCGGESIAPCTLQAGLVEHSIEHFRKHHPVRYAIYLEALRAEHQPDGPGSVKPEALKQLRLLNRLDNYILRHESGLDKTLRPRQMEVIKAIRNALERGERSGYIKLPTGAGKTVIFSELVEAFQERAIIAVPTKQLVTQTNKRLEQFTSGMPVTSYYQDSKDVSGTIITTTYDSLISTHDQRIIVPQDFTIAVLDEGHRALGPERARVTAEFKQHCITLAFTATPSFNEEKNLANELGSPIYEMSFAEAVQGKMLCPTNWIPVRARADLSKVRITASGEYDEKDREAAMNTKVLNAAAAEVFSKYFPGRTGVAFCCGVQHAKDVAQTMQEKGIAAEATWGGDPDLQGKLDRLASGETKILCNAQLLIEGFDDCGISVCLNLAPTRSIVSAEQRGGRVCRLNEKEPFKQCFVVDFIPQNLNSDHMPVLFSEIMGGTALGEVAPLFGESQGNGSLTFEAPHIEGVEVILDPVEIAAFLHENGILLSGEVEDGWTPVRDLHRHFPELPSQMVPFLARDLGLQNDPSMMRFFKLSGEFGSIVLHVSDALITELDESLQSMPEHYSLLRSIKFPGLSEADSMEVVREAAVSAKLSKELKCLTGKIEIVGPNLFAEASRLASERVVLAPDGWISRVALEEQYSDYRWNEIRFAFNKAAGERQDANGEFSDSITGARMEYFNAELLPQFEETLFRMRQVQAQVRSEGWVNTKELADKLNVNRARLMQLGLKLASSDAPVGELPFTGGTAYYYSPALVRKIETTLSEAAQAKKPPEVPAGMARLDLAALYPEVKGADRKRLIERLSSELGVEFSYDTPKQTLVFPKEALPLVRESFERETIIKLGFKSWSELYERYPHCHDVIAAGLVKFQRENSQDFKTISYRGKPELFLRDYLWRSFANQLRDQETRRARQIEPAKAG